MQLQFRICYACPTARATVETGSVIPTMHNDGSVIGVSRNAQHGFSKPSRQRITLIENHGVEGDAHAGKHVRHRFIARAWPTQTNRRQVHLIRGELFNELREAGHSVGVGDLGENVTTTGLELEHLPLGTKLHLGETAVVELTGLRTPCALKEDARRRHRHAKVQMRRAWRGCRRRKG
jgi:MOSC domain-containing protein YiiM